MCVCIYFFFFATIYTYYKRIYDNPETVYSYEKRNVFVQSIFDNSNLNSQKTVAKRLEDLRDNKTDLLSFKFQKINNKIEF